LIATCFVNASYEIDYEDVDFEEVDIGKVVSDNGSEPRVDEVEEAVKDIVIATHEVEGDTTLVLVVAQVVDATYSLCSCSICCSIDLLYSFVENRYFFEGVS